MHSDTMSRIIEITTPLDKDLLRFHTMRATEEISRPFEYELVLLSEDPQLPLEELLGAPMDIALECVDGAVRHFNGICARVSQGGRQGRFHLYHATLRPWLWLLTRTKNCRIFQEKNVPDILKEMFGHHQGIADVRVELTDAYGPWVYCVQYCESDFAFVSRLMEQEGMYYFFKHSAGKHTLVIADSPNAHTAEYEEPIPFIGPEERVRPEQEHISQWSVSRELQPGRYALAAYDFERPSVDLNVRSSFERQHAQAAYEVFEYGGDYVDRADGESYARTRIEEQQSKYHRVKGETNARALAAGDLFTLASHPRADQNGEEYLVVSTYCELRAGEHEARDSGAAEYHCTFTALNSHEPFRAERATPKPIVQGPQTAVVVGPAGEEIYKDDHERVKVQFHWDRYGKRNENSSCWIRVSQPWAGKGWGAMSTPRIGQEVIVDFLEGDPDQPIITGRVYNAENMPPHGGVVSGLKSNTHKGSGYNSLTMNDTAGQEQFNVHAQHDLDTTVENSETRTIKAGTQTVTVKGDTSLTVQAGSRTVSVTGGDYSSTASDAIILHGLSKGVSITGDAKGVGIIGNGEGVGIVGNGQGVGIIGNDKGVGIEGNAEGVSITGKGKGVGIKGEPDFFAEGTASAGLKAPVVDIGDKEINIVGTKITIAAGGSSIVVDPSGVTIVGPLIKIN